MKSLQQLQVLPGAILVIFKGVRRFLLNLE